jgi:WS/DGAT/MGAT family acyltransferase
VAPNEPWQPEDPPAPGELLSDAVQDNARMFSEKNPFVLATGAVSNARRLRKASEVIARFATQPAVTAPFNAGIVGPSRKVRWIKESFDDIREIRKQLGGTINDVVLTVVSEAVARYLASHDEAATAGEYLRIMCPVNVRTEDKKGALGNEVSAIFPRLPAEPLDPVQRLHAVIGETERIKREEEAQALTVLQESLPYVPPVGMLGTQLVGTRMDPTAAMARMQLPAMPRIGGFRPPNVGINFVCTNVPGVQVPQYMCGLEVIDTIGLLVLTGPVGFSITILSYNRQLFFSFICDPHLLPDLEVIAAGADEVFNELLNAAAEAAGSRAGQR